MAVVQWIKIVVDIFDDEKILLIEQMPDADSLIVIWFKLLCLAGKQNNSGVFILNSRIAYTDEMFAAIFRRPINTVRLALNTFEQFGMIERINNAVTIPNWGKHQSIDRIERNKEYMRTYMRERRAEQRLLADSAGKQRKPNCKTNSETNSETNVSGADKNRIDIDKNRIDNNNADAGCGDKNTACAYASSNLKYLSPNAMDELNSFIDDLSSDIVKHAVDRSCELGVRTWAFCKSILNGYIDENVKSVVDAKAVDAKHKGGKKTEQKPKFDYEQRQYSKDDFGDDFFFDPLKMV